MIIQEAPPSRAHEVLDTTGARLYVRDWGPESGFPVIHHHGTPSSSLAIPGGWTAPDDLGIRLVTFDRPGYGHSQPMPGRTVADAARWTGLIADALGFDRFSLFGTSGGAPHAAAAAALLGQRVHKLCLVAGLGPDELPAFDPAADTLPELRNEIACARAGESLLRQLLTTLMVDPLSDWLPHLADPDVEILGRGDVRIEDQAIQAEVFRQDIEGWLEDDLALFHRPWGCDLAGVICPTLLLYGVEDVVVPAAHGDAYRLALGHGQLVKLPDAGHWLRDYEPDALRWLVRQDDGPAYFVT